MATIKIDDLNQAIKGVLEDYNEGVVAGLKKEIKRSTNELVQKTKETAPVGNRSKHYRDNITSKTINETRSSLTKAWYVRGSDYRLTHLLNDGHALRDGGRYPGTKFLEKAVNLIVTRYISRVEEVLKRG